MPQMNKKKCPLCWAVQTKKNAPYALFYCTFFCKVLHYKCTKLAGICK